LGEAGNEVLREREASDDLKVMGAPSDAAATLAPQTIAPGDNAGSDGVRLAPVAQAAASLGTASRTGLAVAAASRVEACSSCCLPAGLQTGGSWHYFEESGKWGVQLPDGIGAFPSAKIYKQLENAEFDSILSFFTILPKPRDHVPS